ncbi:MAG: LemA family protein, partial [Gallionella sp.]|nr:LemA family protein [Gallionella sp.]
NRITGLENGIADRRELYNESVNIYNVGIEQFPAVLIANVFAYHPRPLLEFAAVEKTDVEIKTLFS